MRESRLFKSNSSNKIVKLISIRRSMFDRRWFKFTDMDQLEFEMKEEEFKSLYTEII